MPNTIKPQINETLIKAMKAKDKDRVNVLRFVLSKIKQQEIDQRTELTNDEVVVILRKLAKQLEQSIEQYRQADRADLLKKSMFELNIISTYLPKALDEKEKEIIIKEAIQTAQATSIRDIGKVMQALKAKFGKQVDLSTLITKVKAFLSKE
jgi:uncharacterized protein YqeY